MSIHPSLKGVNDLVGQRSVFTRIERWQKLMRDGKFDSEESPYGLPKVRTFFKVKKVKNEAGEDDDSEATENAEEADAS